MASAILGIPKLIAFLALELCMGSPASDRVGLICPILGQGGEERIIRETERVHVQTNLNSSRVQSVRFLMDAGRD